MTDPNNLYILTNGVFDQIEPPDVNERAYLESLIRADYEKYHPDETLEDHLKQRARFSKEDKGLLRDWMVVLRWRRLLAPMRRGWLICTSPLNE